MGAPCRQSPSELSDGARGLERTPIVPLGQGGERLHEWVFGLASWREHHGESGGARNADDEILR